MCACVCVCVCVCVCGGGGGSSFMVRGVKRSVFCVQVGVKCYRYGSCIVT